MSITEVANHNLSPEHTTSNPLAKNTDNYNIDEISKSNYPSTRREQEETQENVHERCKYFEIFLTNPTTRRTKQTTKLLVDGIKNTLIIDRFNINYKTHITFNST